MKVMVFYFGRDRATIKKEFVKVMVFYFGRDRATIKRGVREGDGVLLLGQRTFICHIC